MKIHIFSFLLLIFPVTGLKPSKTATPPTMDILDADHVLVDYDQSFDIPDFQDIKSISVYLSNTTKNFAVATREDISNALHSNFKTFQKLQKKSKLKGKLNPCEVHKFFVRMTFPGDPGYLDSSEGIYNPNKVMSVSIFINHHDVKGYG